MADTELANTDWFIALRKKCEISFLRTSGHNISIDQWMHNFVL